ncbi:hypothetical protein [Caulobacter sp. RHG1]|uniref:PD-(D/E)XK nuclease domain-containing protein n=1 Tax=Caulobacter sp. (strain RHG1) TaxID=2545762 RepID=UPI0015579951|nr:hypothetical protein [Caulobacter sp. RHG1]NQE61402.1 hypothetical protein [Caulobacter sp. RHG1]
MNKAQALDLLQQRREAISTLGHGYVTSPEFKKWRRDTEVAIEKIFGAEARNISDFRAIRFSVVAYHATGPTSRQLAAYSNGLDSARAVINSMIDEINTFGFERDDGGVAVDALALVEKICLRFHKVARQLQHRHAERATLEIEDEYDVQDLLHGLLRLHFDDIRSEEWTPSYAGGASRVDFLLKAEQIVIEVKKTRATLKARELGEQLLVDRERYQAHPDCKALFCFVYDPDGRIGNPVGIERDLEQHNAPMTVRVIIAPRGE